MTKVTSVLTPSTPVDHSDIGFDIDTSFSDMVVEGSSIRSPPLQEKRCLHLLLGLPYQIGVIHSSGDNPCSSVLDALWVSSDHEVQQSNPSLKIRNLPPIVLYPWPYTPSCPLASKSTRIGRLFLPSTMEPAEQPLAENIYARPSL